MAQIIKHRRGSIDSLVSATAKKGELVMATGSVGNMNGPWIFVGETEGSAGAFRTLSKIYQGSVAPDLTGGSYGSTLNGTPFYGSTNQALYILSNAGNITMDLTGNIEGNVISGVTINNLESTNVTASFVSASFKGDGGGIYGIPASGITGLNLSKIYSGSVVVETDSVSGTITLSGGTVNIQNDVNINNSTLYIGDSDSSIYRDGTLYIQDHTNGVQVQSNNFVDLQSNNNYIYLENNYNEIHSEGNTDIYSNGTITVQAGSGNLDMWANNGTVYLQNNTANGEIQINARNGGTTYINTDGSETVGDVHVLSGDGNKLYVNGDLIQTGSIYTTGDITMRGNINIGDNLGGSGGDIINIKAEISSSLIPSGSLVFDLGGTDHKWNNLYVGTVNADNINLNTISFSGLTEGRAVFVGSEGSLKDDGNFLYNSGSGYLEAPIVHATDDGNGTNFLIGNDMWLGDINEGNATRFMGNEDNNYAKIYLGAYSNNNNIYADYGNVTLSSNDNLYLKSQNSNVYIDSYDGQIRLNQDTNNNIRMYGNTYIQNHNLYVDKIWDYSDGSNYLELYGSNTNNGNWWESGNGWDTTLLNGYGNANLNVINNASGNVNIDATNGSVNIHSSNGMNVTGSLVVSDGSGVFNSSLIAYNSDLTLDGGSNLKMNLGHIYYGDQCAETYFDNGTGDLRFYNDCGHIRFDSRFNTNQHMYIENNRYLYTNNVYGYDGGDLNLGADGALYLYSDINRLIQLSTNNDEDGTNYLKVEQSGVNFSTYDYTSGLTHKVSLDNTGSLNLDNVALKLSGSLNVNGNSTFDNDLVVKGDMYVSGNFTVLGTGSIITLSGSQVDIGTNKIILNTYAPFERFAGIDVYDSGSNVGVTGSLLWDSQNNVWIYANPSGSSYSSARFIAGPLNTGSLGEETGLTNGHFPIAVADDHIADSLLTYQGTTLALNTNKFTVDSDSGDTVILGNFTIHGVGATDNGNYSSYIVFRNDDDVLGFVGTNDTGNETDRLLGYNASTGILQFSSLIDGGTY